MTQYHSLKNKRVLVVDDEDGLLEIFREELEKKGAIVFEALNGKIAEEIFSREKIDLIVSDLYMPERTGLQLLSSLRSRGIEVPFVATTGFADKPVDEIYVAGADAVIEKPFDTIKVVNILEDFLGSLAEKGRRKFPNYHLSEVVTFSIPQISDFERAVTLNIGLGGMFVFWWHPQLTPGMKVHFKIHLPKNPVQGEGTLIEATPKDSLWQPRGFALDFEPLSSENRESLEAFLNQKLYCGQTK